MTAAKPKKLDRKNGRCHACLSWDVRVVGDGPNKGTKVCRRCGHVQSPRGFGRIVTD